MSYTTLWWKEEI